MLVALVPEPETERVTPEPLLRGHMYIYIPTYVYIHIYIYKYLHIYTYGMVNTYTYMYMHLQGFSGSKKGGT